MPGDASSKRSSERSRGTRSSTREDRGERSERRSRRAELLSEPSDFKPPTAEPGFADEMIQRHGTAARALEILGAENAGYRQRHREDKELILDLQDAVRDGEIPDGGKVLTKDEAAEYDAFVALNVKAAELKTKLEAGDKAVATLAERDAETHNSSVAQAAGYNPKVLARLAKQDNLILTVSEQTVDDEKVPVAMVATKQGETPIALTEYAEKHYQEFLPALEASDEEEGGDDARGPRVLATASRDQGTRRSTSTSKSSRSSVTNGLRTYREQHYGARDKEAQSDGSKGGKRTK